MTSTSQMPPAAPAKKKHRKWPWVILAVFAVIGISVAMSGNKDTTTTPAAPAAASETAAAPAPASEPVAAPVAWGIGTAVRDGKFEFTVQNVAPPVKSVGDDVIGTKAQGEFVLITVKVTNIGDQPQTFFGSNTKGLDNAGRTLEPSTTAAIYLPDSNSLITPINPGNSVVGTIVFDVPVGSTLASIELHDSAFSGGVTVQL